MNSVVDTGIANRNALASSADAGDLKRAMRISAAGVAIITAGQPGARTGATVTSATAFSMEPPVMIVTINRASSTWPVICREGHFCVNFLQDSQQDVAQRFAGANGAVGEKRYEGVEWMTLVSGAPVLVSALSAIDCIVDELIERYSHAVVLGRVVALRTFVAPPLLYSNGHYGRFAD